MSDNRRTQAGPAMPVVIVGTENSNGTVSPVATTTPVSGEVTVDDLQFTPVGTHSDGAVISSAISLVNPPTATKLLIQALDQNVRITLDGTTPTASKGFRLTAGDPPVLIPISSTTVVKVIQESATADLQYQYGS